MPYRIILIIESTRAYGRGCLGGIASYARTHGPWTFLHLERGLDEDVPRGLSAWRGDGILARVENLQMAKSLARLNLPVVDLRGRRLLPGAASLDTDPQAVAAMAIEHFLQRGFRQFAFCGFPGVDFSDERSRAFEIGLNHRGVSPRVFASSQRRFSRNTTGQELRGSLEQAELIAWLRSLRKPVGVLACNDARGRQVLSACTFAGLKVPDELAVLGVDNDSILCDLSEPPLSSIEPDTHRIGWRSAEILHEMLRTKRRKSRIAERIAPIRVITRQSSDILAMDDPIVSSAMRIIRAKAFSSLNVETLLDDLTVSRATLERRFKSTLGHSPRHEILATRLARVRQLLMETDYSLSKIAQLSGFKTAAHLSVAFRKLHPQSPRAYRKALQTSQVPTPSGREQR